MPFCAPNGLTAHDGGLIPGIQIATLSGAQVIVDDLAGVGVAAERLAGVPVDPARCARFLGAGGEGP